MAREDLHGSDASTVMSVVTGSTSTQEFINSMQSRDALSRTEANAASDAANTLNTSMNRSERLSAIEKQIANLKPQLTKKPLPHSRLLLPHRPSATRLTSCVQKAKPAVPNWKANSRS